MTKVPDGFDVDLKSLHQTLKEAMEPRLSDERARVLNEILENQLNGILLFYKLLCLEGDNRISIDEADFDILTQKYRKVLRYFTDLPKTHPDSTYHLLLISDFYYLLRNHTREWGE